MRTVIGALKVGDLVCIAAAMTIGYVSRFGTTNPSVSGGTVGLEIDYVPLSVGLAAVWWLLVRAFDGYREGLLGCGTEEYRRIAQATFTLFGSLAILSYLFQLDIARGYFLITLPLGLFSLLLWRWVARKLIVRSRRNGALARTAVIVGGPVSASDIAHEFQRRPELGLQVVGACLVGDARSTHLAGTDVPVMGSVDDIHDVIATVNADTIVMTAAPGLSAQAIKRLSWDLDPAKTSMIMAPSIIDVAGPRRRMRPVDGLSLIEIDIPQFEGSKLFFKRAFDIVGSALLIALLLPMWLIVPLAIRVDDRGPVFFRQVRIGKDGHEFQIFKFRSMRVNADAELANLLQAQGTNVKPLFKVHNDPRITRLGAFMRSASIDELPQLFNVLLGHMSLVGPRPQVPAEVALYDDAAARRLYVRPGVTGLWQVSGRSQLPWEEAIRLDLSYVENWSMTLDLQILLRTVRVVLKRDGAY